MHECICVGGLHVNGVDCVCMCVYVHLLGVCVCVCVCVHECVHVFTCMYVYVCSVCVCVYNLQGHHKQNPNGEARHVKHAPQKFIANDII